MNVDLDAVFGGMSINLSVFNLRELLRAGNYGRNTLLLAQDILDAVKGNQKSTDSPCSKIPQEDFDLYYRTIDSLGYNHELGRVLQEIVNICANNANFGFGYYY